MWTSEKKKNIQNFLFPKKGSDPLVSDLQTHQRGPTLMLEYKKEKKIQGTHLEKKC